jgi:hypothetical protein
MHRVCSFLGPFLRRDPWPAAFSLMFIREERRLWRQAGLSARAARPATDMRISFNLYR